MGLQTENLSGPGFHRWTFSPGLLPRPCPQQQLRLTAGTGAGAPPSSPPRPAPGACRGVAATGARNQGHNGGSAPAGRGRGREPGRSQASQAPPTLGTERPGSTPPRRTFASVVTTAKQIFAERSQAYERNQPSGCPRTPAARLPARCPRPRGARRGRPQILGPPGSAPTRPGSAERGSTAAGWGRERKGREGG